MKRFVPLFALLLALPACGSSPKDRVELHGRATVEIVARDHRFVPAWIVVDPGTKVTWKNEDPVAHHIHRANDTPLIGRRFGVHTIGFRPGDTYSFTFARPGKYFYTCSLHDGMNGIVEVASAR
jgi:plastocyanin